LFQLNDFDLGSFFKSAIKKSLIFILKWYVPRETTAKLLLKGFCYKMNKFLIFDFQASQLKLTTSDDW
jgi:hypothetical protein